MIIKDNFLEECQYDNIYDTIISSEFPWIFSPYGVSNIPDDDFYFYHLFCADGKIVSEYFNLFSPIIKKAKISKMIRGKVNLYTLTNSIVRHGYHTDLAVQNNVLLYYLNSNDGYTEFIDGRIVHSVKNRALFFDSIIPHRSTTCTNEKFRISVNINYE